MITVEQLLVDVAALADRLEAFMSRRPVQQEYLSIKEAAQMCGLSPDHIRRAVVGGVLPCSNVGSADRPTYRIACEAVRTWMKEREAGPKPPARRGNAAAPRLLSYNPHRRPCKQQPPPPS